MFSGWGLSSVIAKLTLLGFVNDLRLVGHQNAVSDAFNSATNRAACFCVDQQELYLGNNKISSLNGESFPYIKSLSIFDFRDNKINR